MPKLNKKWLLFSGLSAGVILLTVLAFSVQGAVSGEKNIYVGPEEVIEGNFIQAGGTVDFGGQAQKDIIVAGGTVNVTGPVKGDVMAAGGTVRVKGAVEGNVRVAGGTIEIDSWVGKNVNVFGGTVIIGEEAEIGWDVLVFGGNVEIRGKVGGDIKGGAETVILANEVGGDVDLELDSEEGELILYPQADIKGNLTYTAPEEAEIKEGAKIAGETVYTPYEPAAPEVGIPKLKKILGVSYFLVKILALIALLIVGLVIVLLTRRTSREIGQRMLDKPWASLGWGVVYLIITPIVLILVAITLVGIPLALIVLALYLIAIYVAKIFVGIAIGQIILQWAKKKKEVSLIWSMVLGVIVFYLLTMIPLVGWIICFLGICWALGAMVETKKQMLKQMR